MASALEGDLVVPAQEVWENAAGSPMPSSNAAQLVEAR